MARWTKHLELNTKKVQSYVPPNTQIDLSRKEDSTGNLWQSLHYLDLCYFRQQDHTFHNWKP
jgi:hypothetical protein